MAGGRVFRRTVKGVQQKTWTAQYDAPPDAAGKRKQKMKGGFKTKAEAQAFLAKMQTDINTGTYVEPSRMTLGEYLDYFMINYAKLKYRATTYKITEIKIRGLREKYPATFAVRLCDLKPLHLQEIINLELARGLKPSTIKNTYALMRTPLNQAVKWEIIPKNPIEAVVLPRKQKTQVKSLTPDQVSLLLSAAEGTRMKTFYYLALRTGMRRGELLGLRWQDVDLETGTITVRRTSNYVNGQGTVFEEHTKTEAGMRDIAISKQAVEALQQLMLSQKKDRLATGSSYLNKDGLIFVKEDGSPVSPLYVTEHFKKVMRKIGCESLHFHCLRHTHATFLLAQGENVKLIADRLGHKDASMTINTYSHVLPNAQKNAAERLDEYLENMNVRA